MRETATTTLIWGGCPTVFQMASKVGRSGDRLSSAGLLEMGGSLSWRPPKVVSILKPQKGATNSNQKQDPDQSVKVPLAVEVSLAEADSIRIPSGILPPINE